MKIAFYPETCANAGKPVMESFYQSLQSVGEDISKISYPNFDDTCDAAVIWSYLWDGKNKEQIFNHYRSKNINVIIMEVGGLERNVYWKIGLNGINRAAEFGNYNCPSDRWEKLNIKLKPWKNEGEHIILCGQNERSAAWPNNLKMSAWVTDTIKQIRSVSDRPIIVRPHPRAQISGLEITQSNVTIVRPEYMGGYDDFDYPKALKEAWAVVSYNSNPAMEAVFNGIPVFVDETSLSYEVGNTDLLDIENPKKPDRTQWSHNLAYIEWNVQEIEQGLPWQRIKKLL